MSQEQLTQVKEAAETALRKLMDLVSQSPELSAEIKALMDAKDPVQEYTALVMAKPRIAEQILRISFATLGNVQTAEHIRRQLAGEQM